MKSIQSIITAVIIGTTAFFIHNKITLFGGQILDKICRLLRELLDQLPIGQIDSYLAVILEYHRMSCKIKVFRIFLKNTHFWEISTQNA